MDRWTNGKADRQTDEHKDEWTNPALGMHKTHLKIQFYPYIAS